MIYCIENNQYGMGTSKERSSSNSTYYTMGNHIPGFKLDGMNVLMIREVSWWGLRGRGSECIANLVDTGMYVLTSVPQGHCFRRIECARFSCCLELGYCFGVNSCCLRKPCIRGPSDAFLARLAARFFAGEFSRQSCSPRYPPPFPRLYRDSRLPRSGALRATAPSTSKSTLTGEKGQRRGLGG